MIIGVTVILLGGLGVYYALTGNDPLDALRRALTGQPPLPPVTGIGGTAAGGKTTSVEAREGGTVPSNLRTRNVRGVSVILVPSALRAYVEAVKCYGRAIAVSSSYRSPSEQANLYREKPDVAAPPGSSLHERGLAIDVSGVNSSMAQCLKQAGWFQGSPFGEPWHFSYGVRG